MATKRSIWVLFGILVISAWVLGSSLLPVILNRLSNPPLSRCIREIRQTMARLPQNLTTPSCNFGLKIFLLGQHFKCKSTIG